MYNTEASYANKEKFFQYVITAFNLPLTSEYSSVFIELNYYNYHYHAYAHQYVPNSTTETYLDKYPEFYECLYLTRHSLSTLKNKDMKHLFDKYRKKGGNRYFNDRHILAILTNLTSTKFLTAILNSYNCKITFPMFVEYVKSQLLSDRKRKTVDLLSQQISF